MRIKVPLLLLGLFVSEAAGLAAQEEVEATRVEASKLVKRDIPDLARKAEAGDAKAQLLLGEAYAFGYGVRKKFSEAAKWYERAGQQGNALAQFSLCNLYQFGYGVRKDKGEAIQWCSKAAEQGLAVAQAKLGFLYLEQKNYGEAEAWTRKAAEQGNLNAQINLAAMYAHGEGIPRDFASAYMWIILAREARCGQPPEVCVVQDPKLDAVTKQFRDEIAVNLTAEQIAEVQRRAADWMKEFEKRWRP